MVLDIRTRGNQNGAMIHDQGGNQRGRGGVEGGAQGAQSEVTDASAPSSADVPSNLSASHLTRLAQPVTARDHSRGPANAPVTLVEYGDFECPYCGAAAGVVRELQARFGSDLRFVFRPNPRSHVFPHAEKAAEAAEAAAAQDKFWEMHDLLFANQSALEDADLVDYARRLGLELPRFQEELRSGAYRERVHQLEVGGWPSHVISTPTFFINGVRFEDRPDLETLGAALARARDAAANTSSDSTPHGGSPADEG